VLTRVLELVRDEIARAFHRPLRLSDVRHLPPRGLCLRFEGGGGELSVVADLDPSNPTLYLASRFGPFEELAPAHFAAELVGLGGRDWRAGDDARTVLVDFAPTSGAVAARFQLRLEYFGRGSAIQILDADGRVVEAMPSRGTVAAAPRSRSVSRSTNTLQALMRRVPHLPPPIAFDALSAAAGWIEDAEAIVRQRPEFSDVPLAEPPSPHLYVFTPSAQLPSVVDANVTAGDAGFPLTCLTLAPLSSLEAFRRALPDLGGQRALSRALEREAEFGRARRATELLRREQLTLLRTENRRLLRLRANLLAERSNAEDGSRLRQSAEAILAHFATLPRGSTELVCEDWTAPEGPPIRVELDSALGAKENAERYFKRARRWERGEPHRERRLTLIDRAVAALSLVESKVTAADQPPKSAALKRDVESALGALGVSEATKRFGEEADGAATTRATSERESKKGPAFAPGAGGGGGGGAAHADHRRKPDPSARFHPREYKTRDGWTVIVGRTNQENDYVSHRLAKPDDLWFHAHGCPGSHVVLRRDGRKDNPSAKTIEEAAGIAAFFSKARHAGKAPVVYTLKKYVRKPRGGKAGLAVIQREKMIMVAPRNPDEGRVAEWMEDE